MSDGSFLSLSDLPFLFKKCASWEQSLPGVDGRLESNKVPGAHACGPREGWDAEARGLGGGYPVTDSGMHRGAFMQPSYPSARWLGHSLKGTEDVDSTESAFG